MATGFNFLQNSEHKIQAEFAANNSFPLVRSHIIKSTSFHDDERHVFFNIWASLLLNQIFNIVLESKVVYLPDLFFRKVQILCFH